MKKALIFGVSGQDGAYLAQLLIDKGYAVCGTSRDAQVSSFQNLIRLGIREQLKLESVALNDFRSVLQILNKFQPDEVYNLSGQSSVSLSFDQPVETFESISLGTLNVLEALRFIDRPIKFYNAASSECFGDTEGKAADETMPFRPKSPYAVAKASAFWQVANYRKAYDLFACSGILFNHESPLRPERFVTQKIVSAANRIAKGSKEKLYLGDISIQRDWGWAPEYVKAMWLMLQQGQPDDYVIATGESCKLEDFVAAAFACVGLDWRDRVVIDTSLFRPTEIAVSKGNPAKARKKLGWQAHYKLNDNAVVQMMLQAQAELVNGRKTAAYNKERDKYLGLATAF
ncbi:MAG: GDP-mannose 4,6-dehydratase [Chroococcidiopsis cubana SAG 39.79]|uniref:GDP-mannose 4,6-dehydratase n=1 Tax=Chroococcidiopsis cubana SAG 39.79 TaxID=388085 RepID=A0AB37UH69_9CYAN|nr:GDP-mannose 4,6-dehydratase [Chroococcidiopsis cubana]MDZ4875526.1 GDP-mannose 4,6-dehydratase [Chroococcidiopsis cubana SAG 39.79]PSB64435.1 GDP-mannose 4,6-dehydratase [Chroococcidiopsis cubana CCALA 043]RUT10533.1 GDP-mannose 4,6-dehydratase [Chroococcidiopsis cubana SAG 39.79]